MRRYVQYMYSYPHKTAYRPLEGASLEDRAGLLAERENEGYIHLPFCESKCGYCNLFSVAGADPALIEAYLDRVEIQASQYREMFERQEKMPVFSSLTVGGGTPLLLSPAQLQRMFSIVKRTAPMTEKPEIIVETAPNQTTEEKLALLRENGVTRVSIGVQSFLDSELLTMGRRHRAAQAEKALELMKRTGFDCVNLDLIYGVPGQTKESFLFSVAKAVSFEPQELFLYPLYVRKGVSMAEGIADEEQAYSLYCEAVSFLKARGYRRDSMRRFVRSDRPPVFRECGYGNTLSLGCGGRSYLGNLHACAPFAVRPGQCRKRIQEFLDTEDYLAVPYGIVLSEDEEKRRYSAKHLLFGPGISLDAYRSRFGTEPEADFPFLRQWKEQGLALEEERTQETGERGLFLRLTEEGIGWSDALGPEFISSEVRRKMEEFQI